ncbi:MAG: hypothetical protein WCT18_01250 [Patescibacteria group bacterium]
MSGPFVKSSGLDLYISFKNNELLRSLLLKNGMTEIYERYLSYLPVEMQNDLQIELEVASPYYKPDINVFVLENGQVEISLVYDDMNDSRKVENDAQKIVAKLFKPKVSFCPCAVSCGNSMYYIMEVKLSFRLADVSLDVFGYHPQTRLIVRDKKNRRLLDIYDNLGWACRIFSLRKFDFAYDFAKSSKKLGFTNFIYEPDWGEEWFGENSEPVTYEKLRIMQEYLNRNEDISKQIDDYNQFVKERQDKYPRKDGLMPVQLKKGEIKPTILVNNVAVPC